MSKNPTKFQYPIDILNRRFGLEDINTQRFEVGKKTSFLGILKIAGEDVQI